MKCLSATMRKRTAEPFVQGGAMSWILKGILAAIAAASLLTVQVAAGSAIAAEKAVAPEHNPPGDIPDTQVFVTYASPLGFTIKVPEGWSRKDDAQSAVFSDK